LSLRKILYTCLGLAVGLSIVAGLAVALFPAWYSYTENRNFRLLREKSELDCERMPLHCLVETNAFDGIRRYAADDRNLELEDNWGQTALHRAVRENRKEAVELLLSLGANPDARNERGVSVLHDASLAESFDLAHLLLAQGADVDLMNDHRYPSTTLHTCVQYGRAECIRFLLDNGAKTSIEDSFGYTVMERLQSNESVSRETREMIRQEIENH